MYLLTFATVTAILRLVGVRLTDVGAAVLDDVVPWRAKERGFRRALLIGGANHETDFAGLTAVLDDGN